MIINTAVDHPENTDEPADEMTITCCPSVQQ
jgi:hypothetical protein